MGLTAAETIRNFPELPLNAGFRDHPMLDSQTTPQMLTVAETAERLKISADLVRSLIAKGSISASRYSARGHYRVSETALAEFIAAREAVTAESCRCARKGCRR
jgi:excisionase family DNA binding protein